MLKPALTGVCLTIAALPGLAQARELSGPQITSLVAGATVEIDTPAGTKLPLRYGQEGRVTGEARDLAWHLGSATDTGRWWVEGDRLCHKWVRWFNSEPQCMRLSREGRGIRWLSQDGYTGTAMITVPGVAQASAASALGSLLAKRFAETPPAGPPPKLLGEPARKEAAGTGPASAGPAPTSAAKEAAAAPPPALLPPPPVPPPAPTENKAEPKAPPAVAEKKSEPEQPGRAMFKVANVRADDVLNVRSGPSAEHDIVGELAPGSRGIAITAECRARWCPVQHDKASGWVNSAFLVPEVVPAALHGRLGVPPVGRGSLEAPRSCLTPPARRLLDRIEQAFGPVQVISTCRPGALIAGTARLSRHASGNAVDFKAGARRAAILDWLIANHRSGGIMTYAGMDHIHVDIGPRFVSIAGGPHWSSWRRGD